MRFFVAAAAVSLGACETGFAGGQDAKTAIVDPDGDADSEAMIRGVELGEFRIRAYYPVEAQKSTVRFVLYAAVASERFGEAQQLVDGRRHKLRDQVITVTRMAPLGLFNEPELAQFRRRILLRLRRALPELPVDDIYVSDFQLTVQSL